MPEGRFHRLDADVAALPGLTAGAKITFAVLSNWLTGSTPRSPGVRRLQSECGMSRPSVLRAIGELADAGLIEAQHVGSGLRSAYTITPPTEWKPKAVKNLYRSRTFTGSGKEPLPVGGKEPLPVVVKNLDHVKKERTNQKELGKTPAPTAAGGSAPKLDFWKVWIKAWRASRPGAPDPARLGADLRAGKELGKAVADADELERVFSAYLADADAFLTKQGHALRLLPGRLQAYRSGASGAGGRDAEVSRKYAEYAAKLEAQANAV
jgi:hypothetical protein